MKPHSGFEPETFSLQGRRNNYYANKANEFNI